MFKNSKFQQIFCEFFFPRSGQASGNRWKLYKNLRSLLTARKCFKGTYRIERKEVRKMWENPYFFSVATHRNKSFVFLEELRHYRMTGAEGALKWPARHMPNNWRGARAVRKSAVRGATADRIPSICDQYRPQDPMPKTPCCPSYFNVTAIFRISCFLTRHYRGRSFTLLFYAVASSSDERWNIPLVTVAVIHSPFPRKYQAKVELNNILK